MHAVQSIRYTSRLVPHVCTTRLSACLLMLDNPFLLRGLFTKLPRLPGDCCPAPCWRIPYFRLGVLRLYAGGIQSGYPAFRKWLEWKCRHFTRSWTVMAFGQTLPLPVQTLSDAGFPPRLVDMLIFTSCVAACLSSVHRLSIRRTPKGWGSHVDPEGCLSRERSSIVDMSKYDVRSNPLDRLEHKSRKRTGKKVLR